MNHCEMIWSTAGTNRVCSRCLSLKDTVVGRTDEVGVTLPPLHPRCRCVIVYRESKPTDALSAPKNPPLIPALVSSPQIVTTCKTFDELKLYWTDNYNAKVDSAIGKLHFESVQQTCAGVEAVLKEFLPAMRYLKEFGLLDEALMTTERGKGKINFNPEYFSDNRKLLATLAHGALTRYYPRNMSAFSAGAHEAGHIVEDWLVDKYSSDVSLRAVPRQIVRKAYNRAIQTAEGTGKTINQLKAEICRHVCKENLSECLADAVSDYVTNGVNAALLSREIWAVLKEELS